MEKQTNDDVLIFKDDGSVTTRKKFKEQFDRNLKNSPNGWASEFESFEACIKAIFR